MRFANELLDDADAGGGATRPAARDPRKLRERRGQALNPFRARLFVVVFHAAAGLQDFVGAHGRIAHEDQFVVLVVLCG